MIKLNKNSTYLCQSPALQCFPKNTALISKQCTLNLVKKKEKEEKKKRCRGKICPVMVLVFTVEI